MLGCLPIIKTFWDRVVATWTEGVEDSEVEVEWVSWWNFIELFVTWICCWLVIKLFKSCSNWSSVIGLCASRSLVDRAERIGVALDIEEGEGYGSSGIQGVLGWKGGWEKLVGLG